MKSRNVGQFISFKTDTGYERTTHKTREGKNTWFLMKEYINKHVKIGELFKRKDMLEFIYPGIGHVMVRMYGTADTYRCLLCHSNIPILEITDKLGTYKKLQDIPIELTTSLLKKIVNEKSWKSWFIPFEEKIKQ